MGRDVHIYLEDILESIAKIEEYVGKKTEHDFMQNTQLQDALLRRLEVIGEAAKNIPAEIREKHPGIPWKQIAGLRDVLIHSYFGVNLKRAWAVIHQDLPTLKNSLLDMKKDMHK